MTSDPMVVGPTVELALAETRAWVEHVVIGLGLCPFAKAPVRRDRVRYACSAATDAEALLADFCAEIGCILEAPAASIETTLLVHPWALRDFDAYNDFLDVADRTLEALGATGRLQVASFHPDYRFAGTEPDDISNATNRAPHPLLQLLREASVAAALDAGADPAVIVAANLATFHRLGAAGWDALRTTCRDEARQLAGAAAALSPASSPSLRVSATPVPQPRRRRRPGPR